MVNTLPLIVGNSLLETASDSNTLNFSLASFLFLDALDFDILPDSVSDSVSIPVSYSTFTFDSYGVTDFVLSDAKVAACVDLCANTASAASSVDVSLVSLVLAFSSSEVDN